MNDIFKILNPNSNTKLQDLSKDKINEIINKLDSYSLKLRDNIGFYPKDTVGLEFEFENASKANIINEMDRFSFNRNEYQIYEDESGPPRQYATVDFHIRV